MSHPRAVAAGQRYVKTYELTQDRTEWEVLDVITGDRAPPHAQLVNCRDPFDTRTVSCAELSGGGSFDLTHDPVERPGGWTLAPAIGTGGLIEGSARAGRLLRRITEAVRRYKASSVSSFGKARTAIESLRGGRGTA